MANDHTARCANFYVGQRVRAFAPIGKNGDRTSTLYEAEVADLEWLPTHVGLRYTDQRLPRRHRNMERTITHRWIVIEPGDTVGTEPTFAFETR
jgi:hypothetical protein